MELGIELALIALLALFGGVLAARMRQPPVLGLLLTGAIFGPYALGLVSNTALLQYAIDAGAFLLLFLIGMEFSISHLLKSGVRVLLITTIKIGIVFLIIHSLALLLGFSTFTAVVMGIILSITSTVIFLKILEQKGLQKRKEVELLIGVLILEDIFGIFALTFFSSFESAQEITPLSIFGKLFLSLAILGLVYTFLSKRINALVEWLTRYSSNETFVFISIGIASGLGALAHLIGLSEAVGAFLAGNIVASLKNAERFEKPMHPFIFVFTSLFFFSIGAIVNFSVLMDFWWLILLLCLVSVFLKFVATGFAMYLFSNTDGRGAVFAGASMVSVGEFSLLLAAEANHLIPSLDLVSIIAAVIFLSSITMAAIITRSEAIYRALVRIMPQTMQRDFDLSALYLRDISSRMIQKKQQKIFRIEWTKIFNNFLGIVFVGALAWLWYASTNFRFFGAAKDIVFSYLSPWVVMGIVVMVLLFPTFRIVRNLRHFMADFSRSIIDTYPKEIANSKKIYRNIILIALLFIASLSIPPLFALLGFSPIWAALSIPLLIILLILFLNSESLAKEIEEHQHQSHGRHKSTHHYEKKK